VKIHTNFENSPKFAWIFKSQIFFVNFTWLFLWVLIASFVPWVSFIYLFICQRTSVYLLIWHYNQNLVKAYWRRFLHVCLSWAQCVQSLTTRARLSLFTASAHLDFGLPWFLLSLGLGLNLNRVLCGCSSGLLIMWAE
jgi:hypothetical protein